MRDTLWFVSRSIIIDSNHIFLFFFNKPSNGSGWENKLMKSCCLPSKGYIHVGYFLNRSLIIQVNEMLLFTIQTTPRNNIYPPSAEQVLGIKLRTKTNKLKSGHRWPFITRIRSIADTDDHKGVIKDNRWKPHFLLIFEHHKSVKTQKSGS